MGPLARPGAPTNRSRPAGGPPPVAGRERFVVAPRRPARGVMEVHLGGELDMLTVPRAGRVLRAATDAVAAEVATLATRESPRPGRARCDLADVTFLAAGGLRLLVELVDHAPRRGVDLVLVAPGGRCDGSWN